MKRYLLITLALLFSFAATGCGGGGSSSPAPPTLPVNQQTGGTGSSPVITEFPTGGAPPSGPESLTLGTDGKLYFVEGVGEDAIQGGQSEIRRMTLSGAVSVFPLFPGAGLGRIATSNGAVWALEQNVGLLVRVTPDGKLTSFPLFEGGTTVPFVDFARGPDGGLWTIEDLNAIESFRFQPMVEQFQGLLPRDAQGLALALASDNVMRISMIQSGVGSIVRFDTSAMPQITNTYALPSGSSAGSMAEGSDGAIWFIDNPANKIGRLAVNGTITEFTVPSPNAFGPGHQSLNGQITAALDGNLYFTEPLANKIGRITTAGTITEFTIPTPNSHPSGIFAGTPACAFNAVFFSEFASNKIGRLSI